MDKQNFLILLTGRPACGKTTMVENIVKEWKDRVKLAGFLTREIREKGQRTGFELVGLDGQKQILSHINLKTPYRVGKYSVDVNGFEEFLSLLLLTRPENELIIIDEIGKMECFSEKFRNLILGLMDKGFPLLATIALSGPPFIERIKARPEAEIIRLTREGWHLAKDKLNLRLETYFLNKLT